MSAPKFPDISVKLTGQDGNAMVIIATVTKALRKAGKSSEVVSEFVAEAMSGDYDHVLQTCMAWVDVE